jgi:hypothetical protein
MKHLKIYEAWEFGSLPKMLGKVDFTVGDIVNVSGTESLVLSQPRIKMSNKRPLSFDYIRMSDLKRLKAGDEKSRRIGTVQMSIAPTKIRKGSMADVELANNVKKELLLNRAKRATDNYDKIKYDSKKHVHYLEMVDGNSAYANDDVVVQFSNGKFVGKLKGPVQTNKDGEVMVMFPGRSKGRGIKPKMILSKK